MPYRHVLMNRYDWIIACAGLFYFALIMTVPWILLGKLLNSVLLGMIFALAFVYWPITKTILWNRGPIVRARIFGLGIIFLWASTMMMRSSAIASAIADRQPWYVTAPITASATYLAICAAIAQILSERMEEGYIAAANKRTVWAGLAGGLLISAVTIYAQIWDY